MELKSDNIEEKSYSKQQKQKEEEEEDFHVLAVDDSLIDRKLLEKLLKVSSFKVTCVDSGDAALKYLGLLEDDDYDKKSSSSSTSSSITTSPQSPYQQDEVSKVNLIMTDYCMPGMSGYDLLKRVKGSSWKDVPVVIMSSENVPSRISMCLEEGAEEFLIKPLQLSDLKRLQSYNSSDQSTHEDLNFKGNSSNVRKRKAVSQGTSERNVPKTKGLTVV